MNSLKLKNALKRVESALAEDSIDLKIKNTNARAALKKSLSRNPWLVNAIGKMTLTSNGNLDIVSLTIQPNVKSLTDKRKAINHLRFSGVSSLVTNLASASGIEGVNFSSSNDVFVVEFAYPPLKD